MRGTRSRRLRATPGAASKSLPSAVSPALVVGALGEAALDEPQPRPERADSTGGGVLPRRGESQHEGALGVPSGEAVLGYAVGAAQLRPERPGAGELQRGAGAHGGEQRLPQEPRGEHPALAGGQRPEDLGLDEGRL